MPNVSIIIPHRQDDSRLEATLVSVLENRPDDCEVIVVHDGCYRDPYSLRDEVIFVEEESGSGSVRLLNAGLRAACAPVVNVLLDGVVVAEGWTEGASALLSDPKHTTASVNLVDGKLVSTGIVPLTRVRASGLMRGEVEQTRSNNLVSGPTLACGFYRRKQLLALDGWNERLDLSVVDVELAWIMQTLGLNCVAAEGAAVHLTGASHHQASPVMLQQTAELAVAFGISGGGAGAAMGDFAKGLLSGRMAGATAWAKGLMNQRFTRSILAQAEEAPDLRFYEGEASTAWRRAA